MLFVILVNRIALFCFVSFFLVAFLLLLFLHCHHSQFSIFDSARVFFSSLFIRGFLLKQSYINTATYKNQDSFHCGSEMYSFFSILLVSFSLFSSLHCAPSLHIYPFACVVLCCAGTQMC